MDGLKTYPTAGYPTVSKTELMTGTVLPYDIVNERGVLLLKSGAVVTEPVKRRLFNWGKIFAVKK